MALVRMFSMAKEQFFINEKEKALMDVLTLRGKRKVKEITFTDSNSGIIEYNEDIFRDGHTNWYTSFIDGKISDCIWANKEAAQIHLLCQQHNEDEQAVRIICKILGIDVENY